MMINWLNENINLDDVKKEILSDSYEDRCLIIMRHLELFTRVKLVEMRPNQSNKSFLETVIKELDVSIDFADNQMLVLDNPNYVFIKSSAITLKMHIMRLITDNFQFSVDLTI